MEKLNNAQIRNTITREMFAGKCNDDIRDIFLIMKMTNDLNDTKKPIANPPTLSSIRDNLLGNEVIAKDDFKIEKNIRKHSNRWIVEELNVRLSPIFLLHIERYSEYLYVTINRISSIPICIGTSTSICIGNLCAADVAMWLIRQKQNLDKYLQEWETAQFTAAKKIKGNHMAFLAIKAIVTDALKDYPKVEYDFAEQIRRARIKVEIPNTNLGVFIDAWWGSYKKNLPQQIESLKALIELHLTNSIKTFFTIRKS